MNMTFVSYMKISYQGELAYECCFSSRFFNSDRKRTPHALSDFGRTIA